MFFGLGDQGSQPVSAEISWRDVNGTAHVQTVDLAAGWHDLMLTVQVKEGAAK